MHAKTLNTYLRGIPQGKRKTGYPETWQREAKSFIRRRDFATSHSSLQARSRLFAVLMPTVQAETRPIEEPLTWLYPSTLASPFPCAGDITVRPKLRRPLHSRGGYRQGMARFRRIVCRLTCLNLSIFVLFSCADALLERPRTLPLRVLSRNLHPKHGRRFPIRF